jgi:hypothetical protein
LRPTEHAAGCSDKRLVGPTKNLTGWSGRVDLTHGTLSNVRLSIRPFSALFNVAASRPAQITTVRIASSIPLIGVNYSGKSDKSE